jgi:hypothetical protein
MSPCMMRPERRRRGLVPRGKPGNGQGGRRSRRPPPAASDRPVPDDLSSPLPRAGLPEVDAIGFGICGLDAEGAAPTPTPPRSPCWATRPRRCSGARCTTYPPQPSRRLALPPLDLPPRHGAAVGRPVRLFNEMQCGGATAASSWPRTPPGPMPGWGQRPSPSRTSAAPGRGRRTALAAPVSVSRMLAGIPTRGRPAAPACGGGRGPRRPGPRTSGR